MSVTAEQRTIHDVLERIRERASDERDKGDRFEHLVQALFNVAEPWTSRFDAVWLWNDWPDRAGRTDAGIDLVARERDGRGFTAIQCKCYAPAHTLQKGDIDSFLAASQKAIFTNRLIVSTTDRWSTHAEQALDAMDPPVQRMRLQDLADLDLDWSRVDIDEPSKLPPIRAKQLRSHQREAIDAVLAGFGQYDRGKLIMACGTGKTFTSLKLVEEFVPERGRVLFLVPSISLLAQSLNEWTRAAAQQIHPIAVCSDPRASRGAAQRSEDASVHDLAFPATTNAAKIVEQASAIEAMGSNGLTVVFSTYQSLEAIHDAQVAGLPEFDLIVCDEAHRTTGATLAGVDESAFVRVHDAAYIRAAKRLYMTATPRLYGDDSKAKATEAGTVLASMDDEALYGPELHRLGFGEAVEQQLLADYKVLVLAVDERAVEPIYQRMMKSEDGSELKLDDVAKLVGCWNGLAKRGIDRERLGIETDIAPMQRAVGFAQNIKQSQLAAQRLDEVSEQLEQSRAEGEIALRLSAEHVDGTFNVLRRAEKLDWLKQGAASTGAVCRILTNARCLSEGVDVPALDAVLFLSPRNSQVDIVQSVGRVMRRAEGKEYGYIILPIGVPADMSPEEALRDNKRYAAVWQVLQALRAHDDRFDAIVNKIDLNRERDDKLFVDHITSDEEGNLVAASSDAQRSFDFASVDEWRDAIYAKIVQKVGQRAYWEQWSADIADLAERHELRIGSVVASLTGEGRAVYDRFVAALRHEINGAVDEHQVNRMLAQHIVSKPVFDALFEGYDFASSNPIAQAMDEMLDLLARYGVDERQGSEQLDRFYESVRARAAGIDNAAGKQRIIKELYEKFFNAVDRKLADSMGIVYTPIEVVDWTIHAVEAVLQEQFGKSVADPSVHVLDPFTGTGTFIVRLLESELFDSEQVRAKFGLRVGDGSLHANEIVLLAYYVAAANIEATFHAKVSGDGVASADYLPFNGILLTDTFEQHKTSGQVGMDIAGLEQNGARARRQDEVAIEVVIGNPPYSVGQTSQNDANANLKYPELDARIAETYAARSSATNKNSLYDSYIRAIRWASDRVKDQGIVAFVTNGAYIDSNTADGLRNCLTDEFTDLWIYNLRGNARTAGEQRRKEKDNVFGQGSRTPVAIMVLVRNPDRAASGTVHYRDIGDYLSREEKLAILERDQFHDVPWQRITPNAEGDWINQRDPRFERWTPIGDRSDANCVFRIHSRGLSTARDSWNYARTSALLEANVNRSMAHVNSYLEELAGEDEQEIAARVDKAAEYHSWNVADFRRIASGNPYVFDGARVVRSAYRPFDSMYAYVASDYNDRTYQLGSAFPVGGVRNRGIYVTGPGAGGIFSALMVDLLPNLHLLSTGQLFPRHTYEPADDGALPVEGEVVVDGFRRIDNVNPSLLAEYRTALGADINGDDVFDYVYGLLHSPEYRTRFAADLNKMLPRIPRVRTRADFDAFRDAGRALGELHIGYEAVEPYALEETIRVGAPEDAYERFAVTKMKFAGTRGADKSTLIYNAHVTLSGIPEEVQRYQLGPRSALEWIVDRYQVKTDKASGIVNDPNDWSREVGDPRYIIDLIKRIVTVSLETNRIVDALPPLDVAE